MNLLLSAYLDHNLGDDLFVHYFCKRYSGHMVWLLCDRDFCLNRELEGLNNLRKITLKSALKSMYKMDALVMLGGSIFQDNPSYYKYDYQRNIMATYARLMGAKVFIMGCNVGPIKHPRGERLTKYCMRMAAGISVRDRPSLQELMRWGFEKKSILAPDLIFSYPVEVLATRPHRLGISVINRAGNGRDRENYATHLSKITSLFLSESDLNDVRLYSFDGGREDDSHAINEVVVRLSSVEQARVSVCKYTAATPLSDFVSDFISCSYIVGTRFHSIVLALKHGIRCLPIAYSDKTLNLLSDIGFTGIQADYANLHKLDLAAVSADVRAREQPFTLSASYISSSAQHFSHLDRFIDG